MKVLRKGKAAPQPKFQMECGHCGSLFEVEPADKAHFERVPDQRDGDYFKVTCPNTECGHINNVSCQLIP